jgi:hypothetical protein
MRRARGPPGVPCSGRGGGRGTACQGPRRPHRQSPRPFRKSPRVAVSGTRLGDVDVAVVFEEPVPGDGQSFDQITFQHDHRLQHAEDQHDPVRAGQRRGAEQPG